MWRAARLTRLAVIVALLSLAGALSGCGTPRPAPVVEPPAPPGVLWLIFVDDLHVRFVDTGSLRTLIRTIAKTLLAEGDLIAARATVSPNFLIDATPDQEWLLRRVRELSGNGLRLSDVIEGHGWVDEVSYRTSYALATACEALAGIATVPHRRKAVIYISNGYLRSSAGHGQYCDRPAGLVAVAREARARVFPIDTRLLGPPSMPEAGVAPDLWQHYWTTSRDSLRALAQGTGGFARLDEGDLVEWLGRVSRAVRD